MEFIFWVLPVGPSLLSLMLLAASARVWRRVRAWEEAQAQLAALVALRDKLQGQVTRLRTDAEKAQALLGATQEQATFSAGFDSNLSMSAVFAYLDSRIAAARTISPDVLISLTVGKPTERRVNYQECLIDRGTVAQYEVWKRAHRSYSVERMGSNGNLSSYTYVTFDLSLFVPRRPDND